MRTRIGLGTLVVLLLAAAAAGAQELAGTFDQLRVLVAPDQTLTVIDSAGKHLKGTVVSITPTTLRLTVAGVPRDLAERDVDQIRQRRPDSLANGARNGFFVGLGFGALGAVAAIASEGGDEWGYAVIGTILYAGLGAGIGVGIDALIEKEQPIYVRRSAAAGRVALGPLRQAHARGLQLAVRF